MASPYIKLPTQTKIINTVIETFTPTGDFEKDKKRAEVYAKQMGMDQANTKMGIVMATQGPDAAAKAMVNQFTTPSGGLDYMAMRNMYG